MTSPAQAPIQTDAAAQKQRKMNVFVHLAEEFGTRRWRKFTTASHSSGIVDRLPYGYYRAADDNCAIEYSENFDEWRAVRLGRLAARRLLGFDLLHAWRNRSGILDADVVWTHTELEHLAVVLLFLTVPRSRRPKLIAQSVWLYDRWRQFSACLARLDGGQQLAGVRDAPRRVRFQAAQNQAVQPSEVIADLVLHLRRRREA